MVNHYYFYCIDRDFGPFFLKFCSYFPYTARLCINGHEYVKRQLAQEGIVFEPWTTAFSRVIPSAAASDLRRLIGGEDRPAVAQVASRFAASLRTQDRKAGYRYDVSILQADSR